jgi:hypothetical protein
VREFVDAGYDHVYLHQVGPDQEGFFGFCERELFSALRDQLKPEALQLGSENGSRVSRERRQQESLATVPWKSS